MADDMKEKSMREKLIDALIAAPKISSLGLPPSVPDSIKSKLPFPSPAALVGRFTQPLLNKAELGIKRALFGTDPSVFRPLGFIDERLADPIYQEDVQRDEEKRKLIQETGQQVLSQGKEDEAMIPEWIRNPASWWRDYQRLEPNEMWRKSDKFIKDTSMLAADIATFTNPTTYFPLMANFTANEWSEFFRHKEENVEERERRGTFLDPYRNVELAPGYDEARDAMEPSERWELAKRAMASSAFMLLFGGEAKKVGGKAVRGALGDRAIEALSKGKDKMKKYAWRGLAQAADLPLKPLRAADRIVAPFTTKPLDNYVIQPILNSRIIPTVERRGGSKNTPGSRVLIGKSFKEVWQPAVERMSKMTQSTFRNQRALKANISALGEIMGGKVSQLGPADRHEFLQALSQLDKGGVVPKVNSSKVEELVNEFLEGVRGQNYTAIQEQSLFDNLSRLVHKRVLSFSEEGVDEAIWSQLKNLQEGILSNTINKGRKVPVRPSLGVLKKEMKAIIEDKNGRYDTEFKFAVKDAWNASAHTAETIAEASKDVMYSSLAEKLKNTRGLVTAEVPKGREKDYLESQFPAFIDKHGNGLYVNRDVELELRTMKELPQMAHSFVNRYMMSPWKTMKLMDRPAVFVRNGVSNRILNWMGGLSPLRQDLYTEAARDIKEGSKIWKDFSRITGGGGTFSLEEVARMYEGLKYEANVLDKALAGFEKMHSLQRSWYSLQEQVSKLAKYKHNLELGMSKSEAAWDATKWTFNYGEITRASGFVRNNLAPFFTWQSKILPLFAEAAVKHPVQFAATIYLFKEMQQRAFEAVGFTEEEAELVQKKMPEYIQKGLFLMMPWRDDEGRLNMLNMTYMVPGFGDVAEINRSPFKWFMSNPLVTTASALYSNKAYSGAPIWYDWEEPGVRLMKQAGYIWEQIMPATVPGGVDWDMMYKAFTDQPEALSRGQAVSSLFGAKISPIDEVAMEKRYNIVTNMHLSEIRSQMKRELRKAKTEKQAQRIIQKYNDYYLKEKMER